MFQSRNTQVTVEEIAELLLQILQHTKESTNNIINEKLLTVEDVCKRTRLFRTALFVLKYLRETLRLKSIGVRDIRISETEYKNYRANAQERGDFYNG